jgi:hypothetical protein
LAQLFNFVQYADLPDEMQGNRLKITVTAVTGIIALLGLGD